MRFARWVLGAAVVAAIAAGGGGARGVEAQTPPPTNAAPGEVLVQFRAGTSAAARAATHRGVGGQVKREIPSTGIQLVTVPAGQEAAVINRYKNDRNVVFAEPNYRVKAIGTPNDPRVANQWALNNNGQQRFSVADADIDAFEAWDIETGSATVKIAIVDTGIDTDHPDLASKIAGRVNFVVGEVDDDLNGHGTHVAGTAAALTNNSVGVAGVCPGCSLLSVKVLDFEGSGFVSDIALGIDWAVANGANVINLSLGCLCPSVTMEASIDAAWAAGVVVVAAAGNDGVNTPMHPAAFTNSIAVAATTNRDGRAIFSNYGSAWVDVAAPGEGILSTVPNHATYDFGPAPTAGNEYGTISGTSMAAPHVAGLAGLIWSKPGMCTAGDAQCVRNRIENNTDAIVGTGANSMWLKGRINACKAVGGSCGSSGPNTPPTVTIIAPANNSLVVANYIVKIRATDPNQVAGSLTVQWQVDGGAWQTATYNAGTTYYEATWDTTGLTSGPHTFVAKATDALAAFGTATHTVNPTVTSKQTITLAGATTNASTTGGGFALIQFAGTAGKRYSFAFTNASTYAYVSLVGPSGQSVLARTYTGIGSSLIEPPALPVTGTYTLIVDRVYSGAGTSSIAVHDVTTNVGGPITAGTPVTMTTTLPGQNGVYTFTGVAGRGAAITLSSVTIGTSPFSSLDVYLKTSAGATIGSKVLGTSGGTLDTVTLPANGTYTIEVNPRGTAIGSASIALADVAPAITTTITAGGAPVTMTFASPHQNGTATFTATRGQRVALKMSNVTIGSAPFSGVEVSVRGPNNITFVSTTLVGTSGGFIDTKAIDTAGTYTISVSPQSTNTGAITLTLYSVPTDVTGTITVDGTATTTTIASVGQTSRLTFAGTAGDRLGLGIDQVTIGSATTSGAKVTVLKPDNTQLLLSTPFGTNGLEADPAVLPATGTYTVVIDPDTDKTGSVRVWVSTDAAGTLTVGGASVTVNLDRVGENGRLTFSGVSGQALTLTISGVTIGSQPFTGASVQVIRPAGTSLTSRVVGTNGGTLSITPDATGTFTIFVDPTSINTGSITLALAVTP